VKYRVQVREQVKAFIDSLAPASRRKIRLALRGLESEKGDCVSLREKLGGYLRLKVGRYRILFRYLQGRIVECVFAEERSLVYHLFERELMERLRHEAK
jgi:mRNA-degrading endonuclease RelE of RelBE toxin-antitoxin system